MSEYTQGVCQDGAAILKDGQLLTIEEIMSELRQRDQLREALEDIAESPWVCNAQDKARAALKATEEG